MCRLWVVNHVYYSQSRSGWKVGGTDGNMTEKRLLIDKWEKAIALSAVSYSHVTKEYESYLISNPEV